MDLLRVPGPPRGVGRPGIPDDPRQGVLGTRRVDRLVGVEPVLLDREGLQRMEEQPEVPELGAPGGLPPEHHRLREVRGFRGGFLVVAAAKAAWPEA